jgi:hypothetical protein
MHSLTSSNGIFCIETRRLPLDDDTAHESPANSDNDTELPASIRTTLPEWIQSTLQVDPPRELLCVQGDGKHSAASSSSSLTDNEKGQKKLQPLPRLCLYSEKTVLLLQLACPTINRGNTNVVQGEVLVVEQPFQEHFVDSGFSEKIVRMRAAPQAHRGYSTFCPVGSLAMLVFNADFNRYSVVMYHNNDKNGASTTRPVLYEFEELMDTQERLVDFCFAQSNGLSIFSALTILLLKVSGDVLAASPVVFDGTVVPQSLVNEGLDYLATELESLDRSTARYRQCAAAQRYLLDVFSIRDQRSHYVTADLGSRGSSENLVAQWPAQVQGPVVFASSIDPGPPAQVIENFGSTDMVGLAIGKAGGSVDFAVVSPSAVLPRFAFEPINDSYVLDDHVCKLGRLVDRVSMAHSGGTPQNDLCLVKDPVVDSLLHCVTPYSVRIISTNVMRITDRQLKGGVSHDPIRTTAWSCLNTASHSSLVQGVAVSGDAAFGHVLVARLADGSMIPVNLTQSQTVHEMDTLVPKVSEQRRLFLASSSSSTTDDALRNVESTSPFYEVVEPLVKKINAGLSGMGKIVGSETRYTDIEPDTLAVANHLKQRCDEEVVLPLLELSKVIQRRREKLKAVVKSQVNQVALLKKTVSDLKERMGSITEKMKIAETNANSLSQRSSSALQSAKDMLPTITEAEYTYFQFLKRLDVRCKQDEDRLKRLNEVFAQQSEAVGEKQCELDDHEDAPRIVELAHKMLNSSDVALRTTRERLNESESRMKGFTVT